MSGDIFVQSLSEPKFYEVGVVVTKDGEGGVYEAYRSFEAKTQNQAVMKTRESYQDDDWNIVRLRYIKQVYTNDE